MLRIGERSPTGQGTNVPNVTTWDWGAQTTNSSQSRIAARLAISQMHVSRLISRTCAQVRAEAVRDDEAGLRADRHARSRGEQGRYRW